MNTFVCPNTSAGQKSQTSQTNELIEWLQARLSEERVPTNVHTNIARLDSNYLYVPLYVGGKQDAIAKARLMQKIEDEWNFGKPHPDLRLLLVPTKD